MAVQIFKFDLHPIIAKPRFCSDSLKNIKEGHYLHFRSCPRYHIPTVKQSVCTIVDNLYFLSKMF